MKNTKLNHVHKKSQRTPGTLGPLQWSVE